MILACSLEKLRNKVILNVYSDYCKFWYAHDFWQNKKQNEIYYNSTLIKNSSELSPVIIIICL